MCTEGSKVVDELGKTASSSIYESESQKQAREFAERFIKLAQKWQAVSKARYYYFDGFVYLVQNYDRKVYSIEEALKIEVISQTELKSLQELCKIQFKEHPKRENAIDIDHWLYFKTGKAELLTGSERENVVEKYIPLASSYKALHLPRTPADFVEEARQRFANQSAP